MKKIRLEKLKQLKAPEKLKTPSGIPGKTILIIVLVVAVSAVLGYSIKVQLSQQNGCDDHLSPTPEATRSSVWDVFEDEEQNRSLSEQINEALKPTEPADSPEPEPTTAQQQPQPDTANLPGAAGHEPTMLESDFVWFGTDSKYASCYDAETGVWLVYESSISTVAQMPQRDDETLVYGVFDNRTPYHYDATEMRFQPAVAQPQQEIWLLMCSRTHSTDRLYLYQLNNTTGTWVERTKQGSSTPLGSGRAWFDQSGIDCYNRVRNIEPTIYITGTHFSCAVKGGIPPLDYNWTSDLYGSIGDAGSFDMDMADGIHNITLVVTDASGARAETAMARTST